MKKFSLFIGFIAFYSIQAAAQLQGLDVVKCPDVQPAYSGEYIYIPDVEGYKVLKCDFHTHTIFSDGEVKPENRVWEAAVRGLDVIAITDHIEYRPNKYITADHNASYKLAKTVEQNANVIVIQGAEITRAKPLGHLNALFLKDANALDVDDPLIAIDKALEQDAFIMWNHPGWPNDSSTIYPVHKELIKKKKIHGVEIVNGFEYYPKSFGFCNDYGLTYMGNTDIHGVYKQTYRTDQQVGPLTIVFANSRSEEGVKEALFAGRTVVKFADMLVGAEENLLRMVKACLHGTEVSKQDTHMCTMKFENKSTLRFDMLIGNKRVSVLGKETISVVMDRLDKIIFQNMFITEGKQLQTAYSTICD